MYTDPTDIFTHDDLLEQVNAGIIKADIIIRGQHLNSLEGVKSINGSLGVCESSLQNLGDLEEVKGDLWISSVKVVSSLQTLGKLKKVKGDLRLRYSNIEDLGDLEYVGGTLSLRDTEVSSLGKLRFVGGDLFLPKKQQGVISLDNVQVNGNIKYWNDDLKRTKPNAPESLNLDQSIPVPYWKFRYVCSKLEVLTAGEDIYLFYKFKYKPSFLQGTYLDLKGNDNYAFVLYYDLLDTFKEVADFDKLKKYLSELAKNYPVTKPYVTSALISKYEFFGNYEEAYKLERANNNYFTVYQYWKYRQKLSREILDEDLILHFAGTYSLTPFGEANLTGVKSCMDDALTEYQLEKGCPFFDLLFDTDTPYKKINGVFLPDYYIPLLTSRSEYIYLNNLENRSSMVDQNDTYHLVINAFTDQLSVVVRLAENIYRERLGMPKIGEGWITETELYYLVKTTFPELEVNHHGKPKWLGRQHLDIYIPQLNVGIEYQGEQHDRPIDYFGGEEAFIKNKERDLRKLNLCNENGCKLFFAYSREDFQGILESVKRLIIS